MKDGVNNYLLVTYKNHPNIEYICDSKGEIRIKVSKISERLLKLIPSNRIYALTESCLYLFDDVGSKVQSIADFTPAIEWYKKYSDEDEMRIVLPQVK
jgi:hypothetical protein